MPKVAGFVVNHVNNLNDVEALADHIIMKWPGSNPIFFPCTGLCSYYAKMIGMIIGFGWGPAAGSLV